MRAHFFGKACEFSLDARENPWHIRGMKRTAKRAAVVDVKGRIIDAFWRVARRHGSPVAPAMVRRESGLPKAAFDAACLELLREGVIQMCEHDHAGRLTDAERSELVYGGERETFWGGRAPVYYCTLSLRGLHSWHRQPDGTWAPDRAA